MADPMRIRAQMAGDKATVRVLMNHEMETGLRKDASGTAIPAWYIQDVTAQLNGKPVATTSGTTSVQLMRLHEKGKGIDFKEVYGKDHADSFLMLASDRAVAFVMDDNLLAGLGVAQDGSNPLSPGGQLQLVQQGADLLVNARGLTVAVLQGVQLAELVAGNFLPEDRKSTRLNSSHT